jgi:hypothetical protein
MDAKTLEVMYRGWRGVFIGETVTCPQCNGTGHMEWAAGVNGNCTRCLGFGVVEVEHSPADDAIVVTGETLPDDVASILALTPHAAEDTPWAEREQLAAAVADAGAVDLAESYWWFAEKPVKYEENGDVLWA